MLASSALLAFTASFGAAQAQQSADLARSKPEFEVASVKPNHSGERGMAIQNGGGGRFVAKNISLKLLMQLAYKVQPFQISAGPAWINTDRYDIEAKPEGGEERVEFRNANDEEREALMQRQRLRIQALLAERFQLTLHREAKELPVYALVVAKNGPKFQQSTTVPPNPEPGAEQPGASGPQARGPRGPMMRMGRGELTGQGLKMSFLAESLSNQVGRTVIDKTGLNGAYDFTLKWTPDEGQGQMVKEPRDGAGETAPPAESSGPSIFTAIQEQLGLKLESQKGPVEILIIDRVERPTEN